MLPKSDLLYSIFEQHLFNALVEDESMDDFLKRVVTDYVARLTALGSIPAEHRAMVEEDLREEVLEMLRKKTYGHYNIASFRKARVAVASTKKEAALTPPPESRERNRRTRKPC